ncbi:MAG: hypothetical protein ACK5YR_05645 [Pirellula sp.]|jgi:hypothetical protein
MSKIEDSNYGHEFAINGIVNAKRESFRQRSTEAINDLVNSTMEESDSSILPRGFMNTGFNVG